MDILNDMFHLALPVLEKILRSLIVYFFLIIALRLGGKRELSQLNPFDLVLLLLLSNTVQNAIIGEDNSVTGGLIGAATLLIVNYGVVRFMYKDKALGRLIEGSTEVLIDKGRLNESVLDKLLISVEELERAAHRDGIGSLKEVESASIDPGGNITFVQREPTPEELRHDEVLKRLEHLESLLAARNG